MTECLAGSFETDSVEFALGGVRGLEHGGADKIVGDDVHGEFFFDHCRRPASEDIDAERNLDVSQVEFDPPSTAVQFGKGAGRKLSVIGEGGGEGDVLASKSGDIDREGDMA